jgi:hypothetical protein
MNRYANSKSPSFGNPPSGGIKGEHHFGLGGDIEHTNQCPTCGEITIEMGFRPYKTWVRCGTCKFNLLGIEEAYVEEYRVAL